MKLRIKGNTIRVRLTQSELNNLHEKGAVEESTEFPDGKSLKYRITKGNQFRCDFVENVVSVELESAVIKQWSASDQVSIGGELNLENGSKLSILVEKDFKCLTERPEDERDMFPNPQKNNC